MFTCTCVCPLLAGVHTGPATDCRQWIVQVSGIVPVCVLYVHGLGSEEAPSPCNNNADSFVHYSAQTESMTIIVSATCTCIYVQSNIPIQ